MINIHKSFKRILKQFITRNDASMTRYFYSTGGNNGKIFKNVFFKKFLKSVYRIQASLQTKTNRVPTQCYCIVKQ